MNKLISKKDIIWNTLGSILNAVVSFLLAVFVIKIIGSNEGGIFSFGYSTLGQIALIISFFGIRPFHIVDVKFNYSFNDYYSHRLVTTFISIAVISIYVFSMYIIGKYTLYKAIVLILIILSGTLEGFADCFDCEFQRNNLLYISGQSVFFRTLLYSSSLIFSLYFTKNLLLSVIIASLVKFITILVLSIIKYKYALNNSFKLDFVKFRILTYETYSLFFIAIIDVIIFSLPKLMIDYYFGDINNGLFNFYFMPVNGIYLLINLIIKPMLTPISTLYHNNRNKYDELFNKIIIISLALCIFVLFMSIIFNSIYINFINYVTNNIYSNSNENISLIFILNMFGGALYSITTPIYYMLIISNKQKSIMYIYLITLIISFIVGNICLSSFMLLGASIMFVIDNLIILLFLLYLKYRNV